MAKNKQDLILHPVRLRLFWGAGAVREAAESSQRPLRLVNSERHKWVCDPHGGDSSKPDLIGMVDPSQKAVGIGNFRVGVGQTLFQIFQ